MGHSTWRRSLAVALLASLPIGAYNSPAQAADAPKEVRLDYAYYAPTSLVLRHFGWLEKSLKPQRHRSALGVQPGQQPFPGIPQRRQYRLRLHRRPGRRTQRAPTAAPLKYRLHRQPAGVDRAGGAQGFAAPKSVADLKGKKIAATKGTDPYLFLLRSLHSVGLDKNDLEIVHLQHPDGRAALEKGRVDAWAGLDPHMAASELQAGSRLLYRNLDFNSYGVLSVPEEFEQDASRS